MVTKTSNRMIIGSMANVKDFGAVGDGVADDTAAIQAAIDNTERKAVFVPSGVYNISSTIKVGNRGKALIGESPVLRNDSVSQNVIFKWIGGTQPRKAMILLGQNEVGAEPTVDCTANCVSNIYLDGNNEVGFLMYGTYLTNETWVDRVGGSGSTEYNFYFARGWYASITNLVSHKCKHNGIALGMPLVYANGSRVDWSTAAPLELNQCKIDNIRSHSSGTLYSEDAPNTWKPLTHKWHGYGIGAGVGNGFHLSNFLSEGSGGVNLLDYTLAQPLKTIVDGYLESSCKNSGLDPATERPNIYIDCSEATANGGGHTVSNIFCNYNSGGILTDRGTDTSAKPTVRLENIYQPRFCEDVNGISGFDDYQTPHNWVERHGCYYRAGYYNRNGGFELYRKEDVNTRYTWSFEPATTDDYAMLQIRSKVSGWQPSGTMRITLANGTTFSGTFPSSLVAGEWTLNRIVHGVVKIERAGGTTAHDSNLDFRLVTLPSTQR